MADPFAAWNSKAILIAVSVTTFGGMSIAEIFNYMFRDREESFHDSQHTTVCLC